MLFLFRMQFLLHALHKLFLSILEGGQRILCGCISGKLTIVNITEGKIEREIVDPGLTGAVILSAFDPIGSLLATCMTGSNTVTIWNIESGSMVTDISTNESQGITSLAIDDDVLHCGTKNGRILTFDPFTGSERKVIGGEGSEVSSLVLLEDECLLSMDTRGKLSKYSVEETNFMVQGNCSLSYFILCYGS